MQLADSTTVDIDGSRILIVDDDPVIRKLLMRMLERKGFVIDEAFSGEGCIERIEKDPPDLILMDVVMDGIDGFQTCRKVKAMPDMDSVPIVFVTGRSDTQSIVEGLEAGGVDYITKPINSHEAVARVRNHLKMRALLRRQQKLIQMLEQVNFAKNHLIGVASHDLRNPLVSIKGISEFIAASEPLTSEQVEMVAAILESSTTMLHLVDELLDIAVIESGEDRFSLEPNRLPEIVSASINVFRFTANRKSIEIEIENRGVPDCLMLDAKQFRRVVDNLLSNAVKYSPPGTRVSVILETQGQSVHLIVEDEGPGIPESEMHKLFTDFGRTSVRPTGNESSTGLGLSICKKIVALHKGAITAENRSEGTGARFVVCLDAGYLDASKAG